MHFLCGIVLASVVILHILFQRVWLVRRPDRIFFSFLILQVVLLRLLVRFPILQPVSAVDSVLMRLSLVLLLFFDCCCSLCVMLLLECFLMPGLLRTLFLESFWVPELSSTLLWGRFWNLDFLLSSFLACMLLCLLAFVLFLVCLDLSIAPNCFHPRLQCLVLVLVFDWLSAVALVDVCMA